MFLGPFREGQTFCTTLVATRDVVVVCGGWVTLVCPRSVCRVLRAVACHIVPMLCSVVLGSSEFTFCLRTEPGTEDPTAFVKNTASMALESSEQDVKKAPMEICATVSIWVELLATRLCVCTRPSP